MWGFAYLPIALYLLLEIFRRPPVGERRCHGKSTLLLAVAKLWMVLIPSTALYMVSDEVLHTPWFASGIAIGVIGVGIRAVAMWTLGRLFSRNIGIQEKHRVVKEGWYRYIRHPGYLGSLMTFTGFALTTGTWWAVILNLCGFFAAYSYRIRVEEELLTANFGEQYARYQARTWRLIPFVY